MVRFRYSVKTAAKLNKPETTINILVYKFIIHSPYVKDKLRAAWEGRMVLKKLRKKPITETEKPF